MKVDLINCSSEPEKLVYTALHQDYYEYDAFEHVCNMTPKNWGEKAIELLLAGGRNHFGPLEHPAISFSCIGFPHSVIVQARTHRVGISFDVQSGRYTGKRMKEYQDIEDVFYFRPIGEYRDRKGKRYNYTTEMRDKDKEIAEYLVEHYVKKLEQGFSEEHARAMLPYEIRQNFVVSFNLRSLMHFLDLRAKKDAQLEIRNLCELIAPHFSNWAPNLANYYFEKRWGKAKLSP